MLKKVFVSLVFLACIPSLLLAQNESASVVGTVTDASGATVPGASIHIRSDQTAAVVTVKSGNDGSFTTPPLHPGAYTMTVEAPGFRQVIQAITLDVDQHARVNFSLQPGSINESITVEGSQQLLETETAAIGNVRTTQALNDLPLNGRNFVQLFYLASGVSNNGGGNTMSPSLSNQVGVQGGAVNGARISGTNYQYDGIQSQDNEQGILVFAPTPDAIQEFKVQTSGVDASFGRTGGGVVNLVMKSGSNSFHGGVFEFLRNSYFDAKNYFDPKTGPTPPFRQNQFGGTLGGRIIKDRTFFFFDYQGSRVTQAQTDLTTVPTAQMQQGNFSQLGVTLYDPATTVSSGSSFTRTPFPNATIPVARFNQTGLNLMNLYPAPNLSGLTNNYLNNPSHTASPNQFDVRVDHRLTGKDAAFSRVSYFHQSAYNPGNFPGLAVGGGPSFPGTFSTGGRQVVVGDSHTFSPTLIYEGRVGYSRLNITGIAQTEGTDLANKLGIPGINSYGNDQSGLGPISVTGYTGLGQSSYMPVTKITNNWQTSHRFTYSRNKHTLTFGYELFKRGLNAYAPTYGMGQFGFTGQFTQNPASPSHTGAALADLLLGLDSSAQISFWQEYGVRRTEHGLYVNDSYRVTGKLTVNVGLRWDLGLPWTEVHNRIADLVPQLGDIFPLNSTQFPHSTIQAANYKDFAPRFGLAYQLTPKTVIRAGYGIYYMFPNVGTTVMGIVNAPFTGSYNVTNNVTATNMSTVVPISSGFPYVPPGQFTTAGTSFVYWPYHDPDAYIQQRNFSLQRLLARDTVLTLAYVGSRGEHLQIFPDINQPVPGPGAAAPRRAYPNLAAGGGKEQMADSYFNSLQAIFEKRFARGLAFQGTFTWAHSVDDGSTDVQGASPQNIYDLVGDRANSDFDLRKRFVASGSYELPFGNGKFLGSSWQGLEQTTLGGWQVNGVLTLQSGAPFSPSAGTNTLGSGANAQRPDRLANGNLLADQRTIQQWFSTAAFATPAVYTYGNSGRNVLYGPGTQQVDCSVFKKFPLRKESQRIEFRAEAFNLFNTPQFNNPGASIGTASAGVISSAGTPQFLYRTSRQLQLALKLYF